MGRTLVRALGAALLAVNLLIALLVFTPLQNRLFALLEVPEQIRPTEILILLSSGDYGQGQFGLKSYQRMQHALQLYRQGLTEKILVCGGVLVPGEEAIAEKMGDYLIEQGLPAENLLLETKSQNTYENLRFAQPILAQKQVETALLVTSSSHMWRSLRIAEKLGVSVTPAPVPCYEKALGGAAARWQHLREILREYGAICYFYLRGWI